VILFEMLTGDRLFEGETATDTMAAILRKEPEWEKIPADANPLLIQICRRCLEKDAKRRLRDIGEVRVALEGNTSTVIGLSDVGKLPPAVGGLESGRPSRRWPIVAVVLAAALVTVGYLGWSGAIGPKPPMAPLVQATVALPKGLQFDLNPAQPGPVTVSPDGLHLAFSASDSAGRTLLYIRDLDDPKARALPGTEGAHYPFWSPDSRTVAFFSSNGLARADILGGPIFRVCEAGNAKGGSWNENGMILFAESHASPISMISAEGGDPVDLTHLDQDKGFRSHRFPCWLPGGDSFLYLAIVRNADRNQGANAVIRYARVDGSEQKDILSCNNSAIYASGRILFVHDDGLLMARPFDPRSGDGRTLAIALDDSAGLTHIGLYDLEADSLHLLHPKANHFENGGRFSPDGNWLCYTSFETGKLEVFVESLDGNGRYRVSRSGGSFGSWGPAGRQIFYLDPRGFIMATDVVSPAEGSLQFGEVREIARGVEFGVYPPFTVGSRTGRIILERSVRSSGNTNLQLVTSWPQLLEDRR